MRSVFCRGPKSGARNKLELICEGEDEGPQVKDARSSWSLILINGIKCTATFATLLGLRICCQNSNNLSERSIIKIFLSIIDFKFNFWYTWIVESGKLWLIIYLFLARYKSIPWSRALSRKHPLWRRNAFGRKCRKRLQWQSTAFLLQEIL